MAAPLKTTLDTKIETLPDTPKETHSQVLQQSLKDLTGSFQKFFKGLSAFPKKHKKFVTTDSFRFPQGFKIDEGRRQIYLPSIGWVKYKRSRFIQG